MWNSELPEQIYFPFEAHTLMIRQKHPYLSLINSSYNRYKNSKWRKHCVEWNFSFSFIDERVPYHQSQVRFDEIL